MNIEFIKDIARQNWHLLLVIAVLLGAAGYKLLSASVAPSTSPAAVQRVSAHALLDNATAAPKDFVAERREKDRQETLAKIKENEAALAANPEPQTAAAYINGIGNMYFQRLQDYAAAARNYERVISGYPESPALYQTYVQLVQCYEKLNDQQKRKSTFRRMMDAFPPDSQQYAYAHLELYGEMPPPVATTESEDSAAESENNATSAGPEEPASDAEQPATKLSVALAQ